MDLVTSRFLFCILQDPIFEHLPMSNGKKVLFSLIFNACIFPGNPNIHHHGSLRSSISSKIGSIISLYFGIHGKEIRGQICEECLGPAGFIEIPNVHVPFVIWIKFFQESLQSPSIFQEGGYLHLVRTESIPIFCESYMKLVSHPFKEFSPIFCIFPIRFGKPMESP
jgi:hypothetical protein